METLAVQPPSAVLDVEQKAEVPREGECSLPNPSLTAVVEEKSEDVIVVGDKLGEPFIFMTSSKDLM